MRRRGSRLAGGAAPCQPTLHRRARGCLGPAGCKDGLGRGPIGIRADCRNRAHKDGLRRGPIGIRADCRNRAHKSYVNTRKSNEVFAKAPHARAPSRRGLACVRRPRLRATSAWLWAALVNSFFLLLENRNSLIF